MRPTVLGLASSHPEPDRPCLVACASRPGEHYGMSLPDGLRPRYREGAWTAHALSWAAGGRG